MSTRESMQGKKLKREALKLLNTEGYLVISDLGVAMGPDRVRAMYGVAQALRYLEVVELLEDAQKAKSLVEAAARPERF